MKYLFLIIGFSLAFINISVFAKPLDGDQADEIFHMSLPLSQKIAFKTSYKNNHINFDELPLNQSITTIKGDGLKKIVLFYEINCAYCKQLERNELSQINNLTVYTFLFSNEDNKSSALWKKAESIWCAEDINMAWNNFITKDYLDKNIKGCDSPLDKNKLLALKLGVKATPTLFFSNGSKAVGVLKAKEIEQRLLDATFYSD